jgi:hypothetical protein
MEMTLPDSVRYVKNGPGGRWWEVAKANSQIRAGWKDVPNELLEAADLPAIRPLVSQTQDFNQLQTLLIRPSEHLWVTFEDGYLWWCTVQDGAHINPEPSAWEQEGHFWLTCTTPWSNHSVDGLRDLAMSELPGKVTTVAGFRATICVPKASIQILRIIRNEEDPAVSAAKAARHAYERAIAELIARLGPKDFELLIDLILSRTGWSRLSPIGGSRADIDMEVENASTDEIAFVQVKSEANQADLNDYISRFSAQSKRYTRMIFVVNSPTSVLTPPEGKPLHIWSGERVAELVVKHGLGDWVATRL